MDDIQTIAAWLQSGSLNIFGLPFAGKDTQGRKLAELFHGQVISGGDILRHHPDQARVQAIMAAGDIIPSDEFESIVVPYLSRPELNGQPLILSEVGRTVEEAEVIYRACERASHPIKAVILLTLADAEVWKRFDASQIEHDRGNRADDNRAVIQTRLDEYHQKVTPVLDWYRQKGLLHEVDGSLSREAVTQEILQNLRSK